MAQRSGGSNATLPFPAYNARMDENPYKAPTWEAGRRVTLGSLAEKGVALGCWGVAFWLAKFSAGVAARDDVGQLFEVFPIALPLYGIVLGVMPPVGFAMLGFSSWTASSRLMFVGLAILIPPIIGFAHMFASNT